ncbi:MAG: hypothetical protein U5L96_08485 [Owenweeksia sp.]|nr:hypothetical protein [Owenweeksia sp.]
MKRGTAVIPKSTNENRIGENIKAVNLKLSDVDMKSIRSLDRHYRFVDAAFFAMEGNSYTMEQIWDEDEQPEMV